jgi:hypothetical protein
MQLYTLALPGTQDALLGASIALLSGQLWRGIVPLGIGWGARPWLLIGIPYERCDQIRT